MSNGASGSSSNDDNLNHARNGRPPMMEKMKNAMKNGLVKGSCDSFGATSVGSSSERSRSGSDEARTATGRAGRAWRAVGGARGGAKAAAEPASRANVTFMLRKISSNQP